MLRINLQRPIIITATRSNGSTYEIKTAAIAGEYDGIFPEKQDMLTVSVLRAYVAEREGIVYTHNVGQYIGVSEVEDFKGFAAHYNERENWVGNSLSIPAKNIDSIEVIDD